RPGGMGFDDVYRFQIPGYMEALAVVIDTVNIAPPVDTNVEKVFIIDQPVIDNPIINKTIGMNKVSFKSGDWKLNAEAQLELDKVVKFLKENPEVSVELGAHTDARGDDFVNYEISQKRAEAAREYIFLEGVPANQIVTKGYGENEILNECYNNVTCTDAQHQQNNRLNVKVLTVKGTAVTVTNPPPYESIVEPIKNTPAIQEFPLPDGSTVPPPPMTPLDTTTVILPTPADTLPPMQFKIIIGPYSTIDNTTYYTFAELNTPISTNQVGNDNFILLGPYPTIGEAEGMTQKVKALGGKTKVVAYTKEGYESLLSIKKLKKMGYK
ncbi:MAG TPA: OmpA family protein, partial [Chitinophagales bacterium]|nr:OmpA family protein [Chitinophagales bacterium]